MNVLDGVVYLIRPTLALLSAECIHPSHGLRILNIIKQHPLNLTLSVYYKTHQTSYIAVRTTLENSNLANEIAFVSSAVDIFETINFISDSHFKNIHIDRLQLFDFIVAKGRNTWKLVINSNRWPEI